MGYRSDVKYMILFPNETLAKEFIAVNSIPEDTSEALNELRYVADGASLPCLYGEFENVKWYEEFPSVRGHSKLIMLAQEMEYATAFSRIGEDTDDTEIEHWVGENEAYGGCVDTYEYMYIVRETLFNLGTTKAVPAKELFTGETK